MYFDEMNNPPDTTSPIASDETAFPLGELHSLLTAQRVLAYAGPFVSFTWDYWLEMQMRLIKATACFQRALELGQTDLATLMSLEVQDIGDQMLREVRQSATRVPQK